MTSLILFCYLFLFNSSNDPDILLYTGDAEVWHPQQGIKGELSGFSAAEVIVHLNDSSFSVKVANGNFSFDVLLKRKNNKIWVEEPASKTVSDTIIYRLPYRPMPAVKPVATIKGEKVFLNAVTIENPYRNTIKYLWVPDSLNPAPCEIVNETAANARAKIPEVAGTYNFNLLIRVNNDSSWFQTYVERNEDGLAPFEMDSAYPGWMDEAIIYEVTPYSFVPNGTFDAITAKLHELKTLGINTLWLQPVYESFYGGQGYDVTDYLSLNTDLGTEDDLRHLIKTAKDLNMRVLFDMVLNHTSIHHPYARDRIKYGDASHYYDFYQHELDNKPYSSFYDQDEHGFINYFWDDLVNLNYKNREVQRWMLEVCKYWVREYDIDGYRFDAIWGVNARMPSFAKKLRITLKSIEPDLLLLAEGKGSLPEVFELGYDAAYDWTADTSWVSQWSWAYDYEPEEPHTIFNFPYAEERGEMLHQALFHHGGNAHRKLRYIENNDMTRFISEYGVARTKMAAALLFSLPGIPMLYNGQEIGFRKHPYVTNGIFHRDSSIQALDETGLFDYYKKLIKIHKKYPALSDTAMQELPFSADGAVFAFHRWHDTEHFIVVINMDSLRTEMELDLRGIIPGRKRKYRLKDILADEVFLLKKNLSKVKIPMEGYSVRWLKVCRRVRNVK